MESKFATRLKSLMRDEECNLQELSVRTGISAGTLKMYENDRSEPRLTYLVALANALDVSIDYLCGESDIAVRR